jgi:hypothetical protein
MKVVFEKEYLREHISVTGESELKIDAVKCVL